MSVPKVLHAPEAVGDPETRYLRSGVSPYFMTPADGAGIPAVFKGVIDDGAHGTGSGIGTVRDASPGARIS